MGCATSAGAGAVVAGAVAPKTNQDQVENTYNTESCAICLENFEDAPEPTCLLACGHTLHTECLRMSTNAGRSTCPICRAPLELGPNDPLRVEPDKYFHKAIRWPNIIAAMRKQRILTGVNDAERVMSWFGAPDGGEITYEMLRERLKDSTPMDDVDRETLSGVGERQCVCVCVCVRVCAMATR